MKRALVTGASGFVGRHLVPVLLRSDFEVCGTYFDDAEHRTAGADWIRWDVNDTQALSGLLERTRATHVIHLASPSHVPTADKEPERTVEAILQAAIRFGDAINKAPAVQRVLYVASAEVYGPPQDPDAPISETHRTEPRSIYGICKLAATLWLHHAVPKRVVTVRPFNQIGPHQSPRFAVASFAQQIARIKKGMQAPKLSVGNIEVTRDWVDVRESVHGHIAALEHGVPGEVYNICSGRGTTLRSLIEAMAADAGVTLDIEIDPAKLRHGEPARIVGSGDKLHAASGWRSTLSPVNAAIDTLRAAIEELA